MFPDPGCSPDELPEGCCDSLYLQGLSILNAAITEIDECLVPGVCEDCTLTGYVSLGPPTVLETDVLSVTLDSPGMEFSPASTRVSGLSMMPPTIRSVWRLTLIESGYPGPGDDRVMPGPEVLAAANRYAYAHGEAMYRGVLMGIARKEIGGCDGFVITDLSPIPMSVGVEGWTAGWTMGIKLGFAF